MIQIPEKNAMQAMDENVAGIKVNYGNWVFGLVGFALVCFGSVCFWFGFLWFGLVWFGLGRFASIGSVLISDYLALLHYKSSDHETCEPFSFENKPYLNIATG